MTDAKELAARAMEAIERLNRNKLYEGSGEVAWDGDDYDWHTALLREAAAALEAQADRVSGLETENASWRRTAERLHARLAALEQAAAPFVKLAERFNGQQQDELITNGPVMVYVRDCTALARAAGGGE